MNRMCACYPRVARGANDSSEKFDDVTSLNSLLEQFLRLNTSCLSSPSSDTCSVYHSIFQPLVLGSRRGAQKAREMAEGAGAPPPGT